MTDRKPKSYLSVLLYGGFFLSGYAAVQFVAFLGAAYPRARVGSLLVLVSIVAVIAAAGLLNWAGLYLKGYHVGATSRLAGFAPALALGGVAMVAILSGLWIAVG